MANKAGTFKVGRSAASGRFVKVSTAQSNKKTHTVETVPKRK